jgi:4-hydroxy-tetrahydrodipicolinate synthase
MQHYAGIWVPLVTPFDARGDIDHAALRALTVHLAPHVAGFVACGSTGEAHALDEDEQLAVLDSVLEASSKPVIMGVGGPNRRAVHAQLAALHSRPLAGLLVPPPYYVRPSQEAIVDYFLDIADAAPCPLVVYNIPYRAGVAIELPTFESIVRHERIRAVKDCGGNAALTMELIVNSPLDVLAGEDGQLLTTLCAGGRGAITASAHLFPQRFSAVCAAVQEARLADAQRLFHSLWPLIRLLYDEPNPAGVKAALAYNGHIDARCRAPMRSASAALSARLAALLTRMAV